MRIAVFASEKPREQDLAAAFAEGCRAHGDTCDVINLGDAHGWEYDAAGMVGVKSRELWRECQARGVVPIMFDKGYSRHRAQGSRTWEYWRVSVGAHHPTAWLMKEKRPSDRADEIGFQFMPWRKNGGHIMLAGSSAKYHAFHDLPGPTEWARGVVRELQRFTGREIVYRPKPSWHDAEPISGTRFSPGDKPLLQELSGAWALVTHGSSACLEAMLMGIPSIVLGDAVARPISSTALAEIKAPYLAADKHRQRWLSNLAYAQWRLVEYESGQAWKEIRRELR